MLCSWRLLTQDSSAPVRNCTATCGCDHGVCAIAGRSAALQLLLQTRAVEIARLQLMIA
jgi:hypothetical protein